MPIPPARTSMSGLLAIVAFAAAALVLIDRPSTSTPMSTVAFAAFLGAVWGRTCGMSEVYAGILGGATAMVVFQAAELAYHSPVNLLDIQVRQALNIAAGPIMGAAIGGAVGLIVLFAGRLARWPIRPAPAGDRIRGLRTPREGNP